MHTFYFQVTFFYSLLPEYPDPLAAELRGASFEKYEEI